ncbi:MAG TPA: hypothetical protein VHU41_08300 [Thermoanaerobaculia bacterium]|jgi:hypothetical protein|nr:hypothetical protein [Thermoanaerobaculia bacterium]
MPRFRTVAENAGIVAVFGAAVALIHPAGNFPANDDWDFAIATWAFARTGHFHFTNFTAVSLRAVVLWGAMWTRLFGASFDVLRASTLALAAATLPVVHTILRRANAGAFGRIVGTLAFTFHPIFIWSACTYMTEVPFVFVSALAFLFFLRAFQEDRFGLAIVATLLAVASWFVRQTGITNLFAPLAIVLVERRALTPHWRRYAALIASGLVLFAVLLIAKPQWLAGSVAEFAGHFQEWHQETFRLPQQIAQVDHYTIFNLQNAALFLLPLTLPLLVPSGRRWLRWEVVLAVAAGVLLFARVQSVAAAGQLLPYFSSCCDILPGNIFTNWGLGPQTLTDTWSRGGNYPVLLTHGARLLLTYGSVVIAIALATVLGRALANRRELTARLAIGTAIAGTMALFGAQFYFDRYELDSAWAAAVALVVLVPWQRRACRALAVVALIAIAAFDVCAVHDYFEWNRARWTAIESLRARGVPVNQLDGGSEASNFLERWTMTRREWRSSLANPPRAYVIAFGPISGYRTIETRRWRSWLGRRAGAIVTLERLPRS